MIFLTENKTRVTLTADKAIIPLGGTVTLTCSVDVSADWKYDWYRRSSEFSEIQTVKHDKPDRVFTEAGIYWCRGSRTNPVWLTENSTAVAIEKRGEHSVLV